MLDTSSAVRPVLDKLPWHVGGVVVMAGAGAAVAASNSQNDTVTSALEGAVVGAAIGTLPAATIMLMHRGAPARTPGPAASESASAPAAAGHPASGGSGAPGAPAGTSLNGERNEASQQPMPQAAPLMPAAQAKNEPAATSTALQGKIAPPTAELHAGSDEASQQPMPQAAPLMPAAQAKNEPAATSTALQGKIAPLAAKPKEPSRQQTPPAVAEARSASSSSSSSSTTASQTKRGFAETPPQPEPETKRQQADANGEADARRQAAPSTASSQANGGAVGAPSASAAAKPPSADEPLVGKLVAPRVPSAQPNTAAATKPDIGSPETPQQNGAARGLAPGDVPAAGYRQADGGAAIFGLGLPPGGVREKIADYDGRARKAADAEPPANRPIVKPLVLKPTSVERRDGGTSMPTTFGDPARAMVPTGGVRAKIAVFEHLASGSPRREGANLNPRVGPKREVATQTPAREFRDVGMQTLASPTFRFCSEPVGGRFIEYGQWGPDHGPSGAAERQSSPAPDTSAIGEPKTTRRSPRDSSPSKREAGGSRPETGRKYVKCVRPGTVALKSAMRPSAAPQKELVGTPSTSAAPPATETPEPAARTLAPVLDRPVEGGASSAVAAPPPTPTTPHDPAPPAVDAAGLTGEPGAAAGPATTGESSRSARFLRKKASDHGLDKLAREQKMFPYMGYLIAAELKRNQGDRLDKRSKAARLEMEKVKPSDGRRTILAEKASMYGENATVAHQFADEFESLHEKRLRLIPSPNYEKALFELEARTRSVLVRLCDSSDSVLVNDPPPKLTIAQRIRASLGACVGVFKKSAVIE